ncbi:MAG: SigE family RNA polymerase sigma factor [Actinomycetota bacterium]|nr:SigE family RNA polymerase sigma factor [Actinomycetota bacterium]
MPSWTDIYRAERDGLVRLAYLMTGSQVVAEDLVQDTFIRVMARLDPDASPGAYLHRSVINACYSWHRRAWREVRPGDDELLGAATSGTWAGPRRPGTHHGSGPGGRPAGGDVELWDALDRLPPRRRTILVMRFYLDMSEADVAETLGCRVGTVKSTTHRALADLRKTIER